MRPAGFAPSSNPQRQFLSRYTCSLESHACALRAKQQVPRAKKKGSTAMQGAAVLVNAKKPSHRSTNKLQHCNCVWSQITGAALSPVRREEFPDVSNCGRSAPFLFLMFMTLRVRPWHTLGRVADQTEYTCCPSIHVSSTFMSLIVSGSTLRGSLSRITKSASFPTSRLPTSVSEFI